MIKIAVFAALVAVAAAGLIPAAPAATSHASFSQNTVSHGYAAPIAQYAAAPVAQYAAAPVAHYAAAPVAHYAAAPVAHYAAAPVDHYAAPVVQKTLVAAPVAKAFAVEHYAPAQYDFEYSVNDPHTGDVKSQKEVREGDVVHGSYSLIEADGSRRVVEYTADDHSGFNAVVHREPAQHAVAVKAVAPVVKYAAAPIVKTIAAPVAHYAAAPVAHFAAPAHGYYH